MVQSGFSIPSSSLQQPSVHITQFITAMRHYLSLVQLNDDQEIPSSGKGESMGFFVKHGLIGKDDTEEKEKPKEEPKDTKDDKSKSKKKDS